MSNLWIHTARHKMYPNAQGASSGSHRVGSPSLAIWPSRDDVSWWNHFAAEKNTSSYRWTMFIMILMTGWWFQTWLEFFPSYMGCHPSHWHWLIFFKMVIAPPTRWWLVYILRFSEDFVKFYQVAVCQNLVPLVNIKIAGKWMFIPLKMVLILIGIDPYPSLYFCWTHISIGEIGEVSGNPCCGTSSAAGAELVGAQGEGRAALGRGKWH